MEQFWLPFPKLIQGKESIVFQLAQLWLSGLLGALIPRVWSRWPCAAPWNGYNWSLLSLPPIKLLTEVERLLYLFFLSLTLLWNGPRTIDLFMVQEMDSSFTRCLAFGNLQMIACIAFGSRILMTLKLSFGCGPWKWTRGVGLSLRGPDILRAFFHTWACTFIAW